VAASRLDRGGERERTPIRASGRPEFRVWVCWGEKGEMQSCGKGRRGYKE